MMFYELVRFINREREIIPESILTKVPWGVKAKSKG